MNVMGTAIRKYQMCRVTIFLSAVGNQVTETLHPVHITKGESY